MALVTIYTTENCPYCMRAKLLLTQKKATFKEIRVDQDSAKREEMMTLSGRKTVPQIFINQRHIGGFDDLWALEQQGKLDNLLQND